MMARGRGRDGLDRLAPVILRDEELMKPIALLLVGAGVLSLAAADPAPQADKIAAAI
jgi:hypothetical protein